RRRPGLGDRSARPCLRRARTIRHGKGGLAGPVRLAAERNEIHHSCCLAAREGLAPVPPDSARMRAQGSGNRGSLEIPPDALEGSARRLRGSARETLSRPLRKAWRYRFGCPIGCPIGYSIRYPIRCPIHPPIGYPIGYPIRCPIGCPSDSLSD